MTAPFAELLIVEMKSSMGGIRMRLLIERLLLVTWSFERLRTNFSGQPLSNIFWRTWSDIPSNRRRRGKSAAVLVQRTV
jgi:hypothetical protein